MMADAFSEEQLATLSGLIADIVDKAITAKTKDTSGSGGGDPSGSSAPADGDGRTDPSGERSRSGRLLRGLGSGLYRLEKGGPGREEGVRRWRRSGHLLQPALGRPQRVAHGLMVRRPATSGVLSRERSFPSVMEWLAEPTL